MSNSLTKKDSENNVATADSILKNLVGNQTVERVTQRTTVTTKEGQTHTVWETATKNNKAIFSSTKNTKKKIK